MLVTLRSARAGGSAVIDLNDNAGTAGPPARNAAIRILLESVGAPGIEIFGGKVSGATIIGGEAGRKVRIACKGARRRTPAPPPTPVILRAGQDLVEWHIAAPGNAAAGEENRLTLIAQPALRPGMTVAIQGVRAEADGNYRIATVTHEFTTADGFKTGLTVRRTRR
jgi:hypothetical protein